MGNDDTPIEYHSFYNDPRDEVIIRSSDDINFRASRHKLIRVSTFFKYILDIRPVDRSEAIPLDFSSEVVLTFLDAISTSTVDIPPLEKEKANSLLNLCNFLMSDSIHSSVHQAVIASYKSRPFDLLEIASSVNDIKMAKDAPEKVNEWTISQLKESENGEYPSHVRARMISRNSLKNYDPLINWPSYILVMNKEC
ncbi:hypothetical protein I204_05309 [Kwoniella mangroviensis CBS 8886]|uniref:uncharacterized protein n=1 Tax=Kwoniella mangroviensis CBS 8507 TaxID=1296122 RepID=UPI00080D65A7|nr:uncharacterized protein I203_04662 [Kwoniella mangroviensis CBS 8507]OCF66331.1 hypothetical protein I203_04662 [Kwoniella mangroviensis CBS 8507]OCF73468.1 hypothetical protein I204_05309 [Kwoniella mangroviensis CBS 8886]